MNKIFAVAGVVIRELYRRKDFYVLFTLTVLITLVMWSARFFNDDGIVRALKEICLMLVWLSMLVIAITTTARNSSPLARCIGAVMMASPSAKPAKAARARATRSEVRTKTPTS